MPGSAAVTASISTLCLVMFSKRLLHQRLTLGLLALTANLAVAQDKAALEKALIANENKLNDAVAKGDKATFTAMVAPDAWSADGNAARRDACSDGHGHAGPGHPDPGSDCQSDSDSPTDGRADPGPDRDARSDNFDPGHR